MKIDIYNCKKKYNIIYADPPWSYKDKALSGNMGACCKYDVMDTVDIGKIPVKDITADDAVLFMWVTMPKLNEVLDLIKAWGFTYKTAAFVWVKQNRKSESLFWGMGRWTRANAEICLIATKGKPKRVAANVHSVVMAPVQRHSQKPAEIRDRITQLCGELPRVELFARESALGWDCWGNEAPEDGQ